MVNDDSRADRELGEVPSLTLDQDDLADRRPGHRGARNERQVPVERASEQSGVVVATQSNSGAIKALAGLSFALLAALAGMAWLHTELQTAQQKLAESVERLDQLEERLASTDTTLTKSDVLLADKLSRMDKLMDENKGEIRKLWGVSYDTNRKGIEANRALNEKQEQVLKSIHEQLLAGIQQLNTLKEALDRVSNTAKNSEASSREAVQRMELAQEKISTLVTDVTNIKQKQTQLEADSKKRLSVLEDASKSTDVFRRNTQEELRKLREELLRQSAPKPGQSFQ